VAWTADIGHDRNIASGPVVAGDSVYVGSEDGVLYALRRN
jgi:outer membrane protein assembly factor BamB